MQRHVYYNGSVIQAGAVGLSPFNRGLHYGDGVFETMRVYAGMIFRFEAHMKRIREGLAVLKIDPDLDTMKMKEAVRQVLHANELHDASVKILAFRQGGEGPTPSDTKASVLITARPFNREIKASYEKGISGYVVSIRRNNYSPVSSIKSLNYLDNILGRLEARDNHAVEALFLNVDGMVAEGATSNIFIVKNGSLYTPPHHAGILNGITRQVLLEIIHDLGLKCFQKDFLPDEIYDADEAFLTNSVMEVMPLVSVNGRAIGAGISGKITEQLMHEYSKLIERESV